VWVIVPVIVLIVGMMFVFPPGRRSPKPYCNESGALLPESISEKLKVDINGFQQGMFLKGKNTANPILLFLNGGPGIPDYFLSKEIPCLHCHEPNRRPAAV